MIQQHQYRAIRSSDDEDIQRINVRRSHLYSDAMRYFSKKTFNADKILRVHFIGEEAVDLGGPKREFFHLLMQDIFNKSKMFGGYPDNVVPFHDVVAVTNNVYYIVGKMISTCIVQGGEAPACFSKAVADYLVYGEIKSDMCLEDILDLDIRRLLEKVKTL